MRNKLMWLVVLALPLALSGCFIVYVLIYSPHEGDQFTVGQPIAFGGAASDAVLGQLNGGRMVWTSNISGHIGSGESFTVSNLPVGDHTITLHAQSPLPFSAPAEASVHIKLVRSVF